MITRAYVSPHFSSRRYPLKNVDKLPLIGHLPDYHVMMISAIFCFWLLPVCFQLARRYGRAQAHEDGGGKG
jgi:hypothetical protein